MSANRTHPEGIIDKNGKHTTVHKKDDGSGAKKRDVPLVSTRKRVVEYDEVKNTISDFLDKAKEKRENSRPRAITNDEIIVSLIGFDPTLGKDLNPQFGGRPKNSWYGDHLSVGSVNKAITQLIDDGILTKVIANTYLNKSDSNADLVSFPYSAKMGYVFADVLKELQSAEQEKQRESKISKLYQQASITIAERYADEVEKELARLIEESGL